MFVTFKEVVVDSVVVEGGVSIGAWEEVEITVTEGFSVDGEVRSDVVVTVIKEVLDELFWFKGVVPWIELDSIEDKWRSETVVVFSVTFDTPKASSLMELVIMSVFVEALKFPRFPSKELVNFKEISWDKTFRNEKEKQMNFISCKLSSIAFTLIFAWKVTFFFLVFHFQDLSVQEPEVSCVSNWFPFELDLLGSLSFLPERMFQEGSATTQQIKHFYPWIESEWSLNKTRGCHFNS